jgi:predicted phage terminase large subunit-like protein
MFAINERSVRASVCKKSFYEFFKMVWPLIVAEEMRKNWHIQYLCIQLQQVAELVFAGQPKKHDLVINISPGSSKSTIVSQAFPAWCWTRMPSFRSINGSYAYDVALKDSLACRDIVQSDWYQDHFPRIQLREDSNTKGLFTNTCKGGRLSVSVGSRVTGYHGHILTIDDPLDPEQSFSEADLKKVNRWMTNTLPSRGIARMDTPVILVQQRLAQNDPSGERIARGDRLKHISIPAELIYDKDGKLNVNVSPPDLIRHYKEGLMDPNRLSKQNLVEFRKTLGAYGYSGQYLQDPVPLDGAMFDIKQLDIKDQAPPMVRLVMGWDKAATKGAGCYSAGVLFGLDKWGDYWVLHVERGQWTPTDRERMIKHVAQLASKGAYGKLLNRRPEDTYVEIVIEKEGGSGGVESTDNSIKNLTGFHARGKKVSGKKPERAWYFASQVGVKDHVKVLNREWTKEYISELRFFPHGKYLDQVDASSLAFNVISKQKRRAGAGALDRR